MAAQLSQKLPWELANPLWAQTLNPIIASPLSSASILKNISLTNGVNIINHGLGRLMQGWFITDIQGAAMIYRNAPMNNFTLSLFSDANVIVNVGVF